jgi:hypothetical protein
VISTGTNVIKTRTNVISKHRCSHARFRDGLYFCIQITFSYTEIQKLLLSFEAWHINTGAGKPSFSQASKLKGSF